MIVRKVAMRFVPRVQYLIPFMLESDKHDTVMKMDRICGCVLDSATLFNLGIDEATEKRAQLQHRMLHGSAKCKEHELDAPSEQEEKRKEKEMEFQMKLKQKFAPKPAGSSSKK
jgi:hypothetical protein